MDTITQEEIDEGLALLRGEPSVEISPPRKIIERRGGHLREVDKPAFIKISTNFKNELAEIDGNALKVWVYISLSINRNTETANPGLRTIAKATNLAVNTVQKCLAGLEEMNLISVNREDKKYNIYEVPEYVSANSKEPSVSNSDTSVSNNPESVSTSVILNQSNQNQPESPVVLTEEEIAETNHKVDEILRLNQGRNKDWEGRFYFRDNHLAYADWWHEKTNQICKKRTMKSWQKAFSDWQDEGLDVSHLQESYAQDIEWKKIISDPNELTKKAVAIKALSAKRPNSSNRDGWELDDHGAPISY